MLSSSNYFLKLVFCQLDVNNAFIHDDLDTSIDIPPGFSRKEEHDVCKLNKSLYGLK